MQGCCRITMPLSGNTGDIIDEREYLAEKRGSRLI